MIKCAIVRFSQLNKDLEYDPTGDWWRKARRMRTDVLAPHAQELDQNATFPSHELNTLASEGFFALAVPKQQGGIGVTTLEYAHILRELSMGCSSTAITLGVSNMVALIIAKHANPTIQEKFKAMFTQRKPSILAFAITEPQAGSDARSIETSYEKTDQGFRLQGHKCFITSGAHAAYFVTTSRNKEDKTKLTSFLLDADAQGLRIGKAEKKMGLRASNTVQLFYENIEVHHSALLGNEGDGFKIAMTALNGGRIGVACQALGVAQSILILVKQHLNGIQPSQSQRWTFANMATRFEAAWNMIEYAASRADSQDLPQEVASQAKLFGTETANQIVQDAISLVGIPGLRRDNDFERAVRDTRVTTLYEGTSEIQRLVIARNLLKHGLQVN